MIENQRMKALNIPSAAGLANAAAQQQYPTAISRHYDFEFAIAQFNRMYKMETISPIGQFSVSGGSFVGRLLDLRKMLGDELKELDDIIDKQMKNEYRDHLDLATDLADLLGDLQVFCASEMRRWNIPLNPVLEIIMSSNFSKLQEDGTALFVDGKLQKGPNYWRPKPLISMELQRHWGLEVYDGREAKLAG